MVLDTVFFRHKSITNPSVTPADAIIVAADKMLLSLQTHMHPNMSETIVQALQRLEDIFQKAVKANKFDNIKLTSTPPPEQLLQQKPQPITVSQEPHQQAGSAARHPRVEAP